VILAAGRGRLPRWRQRLARRTTEGLQIGAPGGTVDKPAGVGVRVEAKPDVRTQVGCWIDCAGGVDPQTGLASGYTPGSGG
jgi:hypothetical protein